MTKKFARGPEHIVITTGVEKQTPVLSHAIEFLEEAARQLDVKAELRDQPAGERSMANTVKAFNILTGRDLTEGEGWRFMIMLKMVRGIQGKVNPDDHVDLAAYAALLGECEAKGR